MDQAIINEVCVKQAIQFLPVAAVLLYGDEYVIEDISQSALNVLQAGRNAIGESLLDTIPEIQKQPVFFILKALQSGNNAVEKQCDGFIKAGDMNINVVFNCEAVSHDRILLMFQKIKQNIRSYEFTAEIDQFAASVIELAGLGIFEFDVTGKGFRSSKRFAEIFGFDSPVSLEKYMLRIHPDDQFVFEKATLDVKEGRKLQYEVRHIMPDRSIRWARVNAKVLFDESDAQNRWVGSAEDITNEKRAFQELQESEARSASKEAGLQNLADSMPQLVWIADETGRVTYYNNQVKKFEGFSRTNSTTWEWKATVHPDDLLRTRNAWNTAVSEKTMYQIEHRVKMSDGTFRWHLSRAFPQLDDKGTITWYGTATDIQQVKDAEKAVRESEERFRIMADATPSIIWALSPEGTHRYLNRFALQYLGIVPENVATLRWHAHIHPDDFESVEKVLTDAIQNRTPYSKEHRLLRHDGQYRWFLSQGAPSYYSDGELSGFVGSGIDIHEWKLAQEILRKNEEMLENLVKERTLELQRSNDDLQQFAHVASHDLKEPIRKIKTFGFKLQNEFAMTLGERGNSLLSKIIKSCDRMFAMIHGVLGYSAVSSVKSDDQHVDLNKIILTVQNDLELLISEKNATFEYSRLPAVYANPDLIHQLFYNLINNSLKFAQPQRAAQIKITWKNVTVSGLPYVEIVIADNGIGFGHEHSDRIFGTFVRLNSKDQYEGSGLGLAMCKRIVGRYGGSISAEGSEGAGSTFKFALPA